MSPRRVQSASAFETATTVTVVKGGRYEAVLDPQWAGPYGVHGGHLAALALRTAEAELDRPDLKPRVINVHYVAPTYPGETGVAVRVLRAGRNTATLSVDFEQDTSVRCAALLTFSTSQPQSVSIAEQAPPAPPPEAVDELEVETVEGAPPFFQCLRVWPCIGEPIRSGASTAVSGGWVCIADDVPDQTYDAPRLAFLTDAWWPAVFTAITEPIGVPTLSLTIHLRSSEPVAGPILARFETHTVAEGHLDETGQLWSRDGRLLAESRQLRMITAPAAHRDDS